MASATTEGMMERITLYCNAMQLPLPPIEFEDDELLYTDAFQDWVDAEGISLQWLISGRTAPPRDPEFEALMKRLSQDEKDRLLAALNEHNATCGDLVKIMHRHGFGGFT